MSGYDFILWNNRFTIDPFFFFFVFPFLRGDFCADFISLAFSAYGAFSAHEGLLLRFRFWHKLTLGLSWFKLLFLWASFEMLLLMTFFLSTEFDLLSFFSVFIFSLEGACGSSSRLIWSMKYPSRQNLTEDVHSDSDSAYFSEHFPPESDEV